MEQFQTKTTDEKLKNDAAKPRASFWSRLKNFTVETPKTVVMEGDTVKLVPIAPKTPAVKEPSVKRISASPESIIVKDTVEVQIPVIPKKPVPAPPKIVTVKDDIERQAPAALTKKPVLAPPEPIVAKREVEQQLIASSEKLKKGLEKTRSRFWSRLKNLFRRKVDESVIEELEDILVGADIGAKSVQKLIQEIHESWKSKTITEASQIHDFIKGKLKESLRFSSQIDINYAPSPPTVIMVVGVNGVGKTTCIAKLANIFIKDGKRVMVAASDTFRAAAVDQLDIWCKRIGAEIVKHQTGSDPAAVAYDALEASIARGIDVLIVDTAGRLHTHENLMNELSKIKRVISKKIPSAPHEVLMVLDATTGQNAISQVKMFKQFVDVTGIFLAKLDGTAKGGFVLGMRNEIDIPVKFVGLGEKADDIEKFNPDAFVDALFE